MFSYDVGCLVFPILCHLYIIVFIIVIVALVIAFLLIVVGWFFIVSRGRVRGIHFGSSGLGWGRFRGGLSCFGRFAHAGFGGGALLSQKLIFKVLSCFSFSSILIIKNLNKSDSRRNDQ
jgi:hypothetical protein